MKHIALVVSFTALLLFASCKKEEPPQPTNGVKLVDTRLGGCNNGIRSLLVEENPSADTLIYSFSGDSLKVFVGINYVCCAPFRTECKIEDGVIKIYVKDVCDWPKENCYCKCMCYYTFDFTFAGCEENSYPYKVYLFDPRVGKSNEIFSGDFWKNYK